MTFFTDVRTRRTSIDELPTSLSGSLGAAADIALEESPISSARRLNELDEALNGPQIPETAAERRGFVPPPEERQQRTGPDSPILPAEEARKRIADEGLDLNVPDEGYPERALDILMDRARERRIREDKFARAPQGVGPTALRLATSVAASLLDPVNIGLSFIPVVGPTKTAAMLARAQGPLGRAGVRAGVGTVEGTVGTALVEPLIFAARSQEQADFELQDALLDIALGGALGGGLHVVGGGAVDIVTARRRSQAAQQSGVARVLGEVQPQRTPGQGITGDSVDPFDILRVPPDRATGVTEARSQMLSGGAPRALDAAAGPTAPRLGDTPFASLPQFTQDDIIAQRVRNSSGQETVIGGIDAKIAGAVREIQFERGRAGVTKINELENRIESLRAERDGEVAKITARVTKEHRESVKAHVDAGLRVRADVIKSYPDIEREARARFLVDDAPVSEENFRPVDIQGYGASRIVSDLDPQTREHLLRTAVAQMAQGQAVDIDALFRLAATRSRLLGSAAGQPRQAPPPLVRVRSEMRQRGTEIPEVMRVARRENPDLFKRADELDARISKAADEIEELRARIDEPLDTAIADRLAAIEKELSDGVDGRRKKRLERTKQEIKAEHGDVKAQAAKDRAARTKDLNRIKKLESQIAEDTKAKQKLEPKLDSAVRKAAKETATSRKVETATEIEQLRDELPPRADLPLQPSADIPRLPDAIRAPGGAVPELPRLKPASLDDIVAQSRRAHVSAVARPEAARVAEERFSKAKPESDIKALQSETDDIVAEAQETADALGLGDEYAAELTASDLADDAQVYSRAVRALASCQLRRGT